MRAARAVLGALIVLILAGDAVAYFSIDPTEHPSRWDRRIASLVSFVEDTRHLRFEHPVTVEFQDDAEYRARIRKEQSDLSAQEKHDLLRFQGQARALGLIGRNTDLLKELNTLTSDATLAYYDDHHEKMVIRGTQLSARLRATIVHELTHALQDQKFGLDRDFESDGSQSLFRGLAEGDADRVENAYVETLSGADKQAYDAEKDESTTGAKTAIAGVPPALVELFAAPYALGEPLTTLVVTERGTEGLNKLFRRPPDSDEGLIDAFAALDGEHAKHVRAPRPPSGAKKSDEGDFGAVAWYVVLSSFVDEHVALAAVDGWGGDAFVGYRQDGRECVKLAFEGDTANDVAEMTTAIAEWHKSFPDSSSFERSGDRVELIACEPATTPTPRAGAGDALALPATRLALLNMFAKNDVPRKIADCITRHALATIPTDKFSSPSEADQKELFGIGQQIGRGCASGQLT